MVEFSDIVRYAIVLEERAYNFYFEAALNTDEPNVKNLFINLARQEKVHKSRLETMEVLPFEGQICGLNYFKLKDDFRHMDETGVQRYFSIINFAMEKELEAARDYLRLSKEQVPPEVKKICFELANEEKCHYNLLKSEFDRLSTI